VSLDNYHNYHNNLEQHILRCSANHQTLVTIFGIQLTRSSSQTRLTLSKYLFQFDLEWLRLLLIHRTVISYYSSLLRKMKHIVESTSQRLWKTALLLLSCNCMTEFFRYIFTIFFHSRSDTPEITHQRRWLANLCYNSQI
jgi:nitric oxide reductase large subunit